MVYIFTCLVETLIDKNLRTDIVKVKSILAFTPQIAYKCLQAIN